MKHRGFTLIELLVYMGIFSILLVVLTEMLVSILNLQLDSTATSSVDQDNRFIQQRLTYDIQRAKSFTVSSDQKTLNLSVGTSTFTYSALTNSLQLNGLQLNSFDTTITNLLFQKIGTSSTAIMVNYGVVSSVSKASGPEIHNTNTLIALRPNSNAAIPNPTSPPAPTLTPTPGPTSAPTPTPASCTVTTNPSNLNLSINGNSNITASVTFGLGNASITRMNFGSYNTNIATVNPSSDNRSPYTTTVTAISSGSASVWATATLSDGRICQTTGNSDTNVTVLTPPTNTPTRVPTPTPTPANCSAYCNQQYGNGGSCQRSSQCGRNQHNSGAIYGCSGNNICCCN